MLIISGSKHSLGIAGLPIRRVRRMIGWVLFELSVLKMKKLKDGEESLLVIPASRSLKGLLLLLFSC